MRPDHIVAYDLPTRPQKADNRVATMAVEEAVEIDAMDPGVVQDLLATALRRYMPKARLARHGAADDTVRETLLRWARRFRP